MVDRLGGRKALPMGILLSAGSAFSLLIGLEDMWLYSILLWLMIAFGIVGMPGTSYVVQRSVSPEYYSIATTIIWLFQIIPGAISGFISGAILADLGLQTTIIIAATIELIGGLMMLGLPKGV